MTFFATTPVRNHPSVDPCTWILLADDALRAGRTEQAEELIEEAYSMFDMSDKAITNAATWWLGPDEKIPEVDAK
jgi:hypothetical protein